MVCWRIIIDHVLCQFFDTRLIRTKHTERGHEMWETSTQTSSVKFEKQLYLKF
jgi:hypothetical protein